MEEAGVARDEMAALVKKQGVEAVAEEEGQEKTAASVMVVVEEEGQDKTAASVMLVEEENFGLYQRILC